MSKIFHLILICSILIFSVTEILGRQISNAYSPEISQHSPVILVPGDGGSQAWGLENGNKFMVWVRMYYLMFPSNLISYFKLRHDSLTNKTYDKIGTKIFFPGWGDTNTIEKLSSFNLEQSNYFFDLVEKLVKDNFYQRNITVRGAPYDFRKTPKENSDFVKKMRLLVEDTYYNAGAKKVIILGHSMGNLYSLDFFAKMTLSWKKKYIRGFIATSAPLGGAAKSMQVEVSGTTMCKISNGLRFRELIRSFPSMAWLLPRKSAFDPNMPIIQTEKRNYTIKDYRELFEDLKFPEGYQMYKDNKNIINPEIRPEGIDEIYCVYNNKEKTPERYIYDNRFPDVEPTTLYGEGDGTVSKKSLELCSRWKNAVTYIIPDSSHQNILSNNQYIHLVKKILYRQPIFPEAMETISSFKQTNSHFMSFFQ